MDLLYGDEKMLAACMRASIVRRRLAIGADLLACLRLNNDGSWIRQEGGHRRAGGRVRRVMIEWRQSAVAANVAAGAGPGIGASPNSFYSADASGTTDSIRVDWVSNVHTVLSHERVDIKIRGGNSVVHI
ncbi:MAG TPA: hypothetical protein VM689_19655 [Aliidongia sp.]|nr:hypothetical protein [Aliidongia sp.]